MAGKPILGHRTSCFLFREVNTEAKAENKMADRDAVVWVGSVFPVELSDRPKFVFSDGRWPCCAKVVEPKKLVLKATAAITRNLAVCFMMHTPFYLYHLENYSRGRGREEF